jgi:hypothetical protein
MPDYTTTAPLPLSVEHVDLLTQLAADPHVSEQWLRGFGDMVHLVSHLEVSTREAKAARMESEAESARLSKVVAEYEVRARRAEAAERSLLIKVAELQLAADVGPNALAEAALAAADAIAGGDPEAMSAARTELLRAVADGGGWR